MKGKNEAKQKVRKRSELDENHGDSPLPSLWVCLTHRPLILSVVHSTIPGKRAKTQRAVLSFTLLIHGSRAAQHTGQQEEAALYICTG